MTNADVITLISVTKAQDDNGIWQTTEHAHDVYCQVDSVSATEFFEAGRNGLNPEFRFTMFIGDYCNEQTLIYHGNAYGVYRTYRRNIDMIELYAERKGGTNGKG